MKPIQNQQVGTLENQIGEVTTVFVAKRVGILIKYMPVRQTNTNDSVTFLDGYFAYHFYGFANSLFTEPGG